MKTQNNGFKKVLARARAFTNQGIREHCFSVDAGGTVRVYDSAADHYTTCHCMSKKTQARIRRLAA